MIFKNICDLKKLNELKNDERGLTISAVCYLGTNWEIDIWNDKKQVIITFHIYEDTKEWQFDLMLRFISEMFNDFTIYNNNGSNPFEYRLYDDNYKAFEKFKLEEIYRSFEKEIKGYLKNPSKGELTILKGYRKYRRLSQKAMRKILLNYLDFNNAFIKTEIKNEI